MELTKQEVEHVAWLARLELGEDEKDRLTVHLNRILGHFARLQELDTDAVEPTSHSFPVQNVFREDRVGECLPADAVLANAPERTEDHFIVPQIVDT